MALNIHEKGFSIPKTISDCKKDKKYETFRHLAGQASKLAPKMGRRRSAWQLARSQSNQSPGRIIVVLL